ncbi:tetratricopeptide repeat protein [Mesorhizobium sp. Z1-4]|uniref:tetratricopeptide repeat protein n=1 Tax=Mesorhizobium sp. Z1-4 TaxID=2448478 RepID=UPI000FD9CB7D|nr:tetratricopeptide repeat protein [Mesorhizobium sp. Z1-4]
MLPVRQSTHAASKLALISATAILALGLAGCASKKLTTGSIDRTSSRPVESLSQAEVDAELQSLGSAYTKNTKNANVAMRYAAVLQMAGRTDQALAVMRKAAIDFPQERSVLAAYGKALASAGQFEPALDAVRRAQTPEYPDWKLVSAEAAILDQLGQRAKARELYGKALELRPQDPSILSNLGMSYVLEGDLKTAEKHMRAAVQAPGADSRVRQNLALVVGLQGRFKEAEQIAGQELAPEQAKANVAYLRTMLSQQNAWSQLEDEERNTN